MNHPSELEHFIREHRAEGQSDTEGRFTLAGQVAVEKLARYQLPFRAAWVVKVIQCAVREGAVASIQVELTSREARFSFHTSSFDLEDVKAAYYEPTRHQNSALSHLLGALWVIGLHQKWPFELSMPGSLQSLVWDGTLFHFKPTTRKVVKTTLVVCLTAEHERGWLTGIMRRAKFDAEILEALRKWYYTCPVPLIVDGRRMDSLQACWGHGWGPESCPLALGFADAEVPHFPLSPGTFEQQPRNEQETQTTEDARRSLSRVSPRQIASVPFLLTHHLVTEGTGKNRRCSPKSGKSLVYWVQDGVVVQTESLIEAETRLTVGCFVNAEGLESDMTTLHLRETPKKQERKAVVHRAVVRALEHMTVLTESMQELAETARNRASWSQRVFYLAGFGAFWVSPVAGLLLAGAGYLSGKAPDKEIQERDERYKQEVYELVASLKSLEDRQ